nr:hypothetical protein [Tanacetum cinerariifolium]
MVLWWRAGEGSKGHVAGGESENPRIPFSFLFINRKSRQTGHYGLTLYLGIERGNIACHKSEARFGTLLRKGRLASRAFRDEAFWRSQVNFGPPNPATDEKALWYEVKGSVYVVTLPTFQRCLEDGPDAAERRPGSGFPTGGGAGDGHLKAHHDLQATPGRPGKATRLGVRGSIVPAAI